jgi:hypothetical protein
VLASGAGDGAAVVASGAGDGAADTSGELGAEDTLSDED